MRLFQWTVIRRFSGYVKVPRPSHNYKTVEKPTEKIPVSKVLDLKIQSSGPLTVADYMKTVLTNPRLGYYMKTDVIGAKGDFITSPEISHLFGEMIAVWIYNEFEKIGSPKPWQLIELGPGKGTLMKDILRVLEVLKATEGMSVHMVEVSPALASVQFQNLCDGIIGIGMLPQRSKENPFYKSSVTVQEVPIYWYEKIQDVPMGFSVVVAHEFFDVLPIHKFQRVPEGWREVLINSTAENGQVKFSYVLSNKETTLSKLLIRKDEKRDHVEVCPEGGALAGHIAERLEAYGGFSLFVDYGHDGDKTDTFRAFKKHQLHDPLINPGSADLTADVDFSFLREVMKDKLLTYGPVDQGDFLKRLGIDMRLEQVLQTADKKEWDNIKTAYHMLVDKDKMGSRFKFFAGFPAVLEEHLKRFPVAGFHEGK